MIRALPGRKAETMFLGGFRMPYRFTFLIVNNLDVGVEFFDEESGVPFYFPANEQEYTCQFELGSDAVSIQLTPDGGTEKALQIPLLQTIGGISSVMGGNGGPWVVRIKNSFKESTTNITVGSNYPLLENRAAA